MVNANKSRSGLAGLSGITQAWFAGAFDQPTAAQLGAWEAIANGDHTLVVAPTGSGKTLAAFLSAIDELASLPTPPKKQRCRVLYISPLKALASDVERNLRSPLTGIRREANLSSQPEPEINVAIRTGDTTPAERRRQISTPPDILITTPESLFLLLTSRARESLQSVSTVIIDEVHAVAGTKRGAHLALSLERLDAQLAKPAQRIGLSATVQPVAEVALFLGGSAPVTVVCPSADKQLDISVVVPVEDLTQPTSTAPTAHPSDSDSPTPQPSIWPHVEQGIVELIESHRSTLIFANSRRLAERLTARINEIKNVALPDDTNGAGSFPAEAVGQSGTASGAPATLVRAHHGSVSKEQRALIEDDLKAGRIPAVVATSSLELGIDMGAIDLVVQVEAPPSVASGLQRVGRAGHQVGEISQGVIFPKHRGDLLAATVVADRMLARQLEPTRIPRNPLDVLAQQLVATVSMQDQSATELFTLFRRAAPFHSLPRSAYDAVLDMLAGRYPSDGFAELRPRIIWDRASGLLRARPGAQRLAVTSGGTIPDRGLFGVFMVGEKASRVGELDEEMVYESRVGDVFALGATSWRIEDITHDRVLVSPAPGMPGRLPFWHGDIAGRPVELGRAIGQLTQEISNLSDPDATELLRAKGLDERAIANLVRYVREQVEATGSAPSDTTIVIERFRDELGDWRVVLHSPYGARIHAPWALAVRDRVRASTGIDAQVMHSDDGIVLRIPDTDDDTSIESAIEALFPEPDELNRLVTAAIGSSALFASRFRECAARALLLPKRDPGKRSPLWQQRQRSSQLLAVASQFPTFPIVIETVRECLQDVYDLPALTQLHRDIASRSIRVVHATTTMPSPFARSLLFGYVAAFIYEGDSPLAERRAAALTLDTELLAELLGYAELRELLDEQGLAEVELMVTGLAPERHARTIEHAADLLRTLGPQTFDDWASRGVPQAWLEDLESQRRLIRVRMGGVEHFAAIEDAAKLRDALGTALPVGIPQSLLASDPQPLQQLVARYARTHGPFRVEQLASYLGIGPAIARDALQSLAADGHVISGEFRPGCSGTEWCDVEVLRRIRRRSIASLRREVEPVSPRSYASFLPYWNDINRPSRGPDAVMRAIEQLAGAPIPASALESLVLPARVLDYQPAMLDELTSAGEVIWCGRGQLSNTDGWLSLAPVDSAALLLPTPTVGWEPSPTGRKIIDGLEAGGAWLFRELADRVGAPADPELLDSLWDLVWAGYVTNDTLGPLRARLAGATATGSRRMPNRGAAARTRTARLGRAGSGVRSGQAAAASGRWSLAPPRSANPTERAAATAQSLIDRYGIVTRGAVATEQIQGGFAAMYRVLAAMEDAGQTRRGYFIEGLGAAQFGSAGAVDQLRARDRRLTDQVSAAAPEVIVLAASDPANPYGSALPWPAKHDSDIGHRPGRKAGAAVVLVEGELVIYSERGGRSLLSFAEDGATNRLALTALAKDSQSGRLPRLRIERCNGQPISGQLMAETLESVGFVHTPRGMRLP